MEGLQRRWAAGVLLLVLVSGCGGGGGGDAAGGAASGGSGGGGPDQGGGTMPPAHLSPTTPAITLTTNSAPPGGAITMSATSTDPQNSALTFSWTFGDGATASGASVSHTYSAEGQFTPRVTVTNQFGLSASATTNFPLNIAYQPLPNFLIFETNLGHFLGQTLVVETAPVTTDQNGLPLTFLWSFGDGSTASGPKVSHVYAAPGTYTVTLTVANSANHSSTAHATAQVFAPTPQPVPTDNIFAPYCSGPFCGAASASNYAGPGVGIWRYHNSTASSATLDVEIHGVTGGQSASLVFTNGTSADSLTLPGAGALASTASSMTSSVVESAERDAASAHAVILQRNYEAAREFIRTRKPSASPAVLSSRVRALAAIPPPALGTARVWNENFSTSTPYNMEVGATCALPSGRNAVFWIDSAQVASGAISRARIQFMVNALCGADASYARQVALTGDVWGPAANGTGYIEDAPAALQDLHIVIPGVPTSTSWGGYFSAGNLTPAASGSSSNGSLAIFINGSLLTRSPDDPSAGATMIHEMKHLVNYYQRTVVRNVIHPAWLEETSAMLSEDLFTLNALGFNRAEARHDGYVFSGGGVGYLGWTKPDGQSYNQGGSFGAFLHRRYGLDVDRRLIDTCSDNGSPISAYQCLDSLIVQWGGYGFDDEFSRHGASVFGGLAKGGFPSGFGYPSVEKEGVFLQAFSSESVIFPPSQITPAPITQLLATMHTYSLDVVAAGQTVYKRQGVTVPAGTTLMLVIQ